MADERVGRQDEFCIRTSIYSERCVMSLRIAESRDSDVFKLAYCITFEENRWRR